MTITAPAPIEPEARRPRLIVASIITAAVLGAGTASAIWATTHTTPVPVSTVSGIRTCDSSVAVAYPALDGGVQVHVNAPGPDVVRVGIISGPRSYEHLLVQQIPAKNDAADFSYIHAHGVSAVTVSTNKLGICAVPAPAWTNR
jgi:hypothetical protein